MELLDKGYQRDRDIKRGISTSEGIIKFLLKHGELEGPFQTHAMNL